MGICRSIHILVIVLCVWPKELSTEAFVAPSHQLSQIIAGSRCGKGTRRRPETTVQASSRIKAIADGMNGVIIGWGGQAGMRQRRKKGVQSLRAGLDFHPLPVSELFEAVGREIAEQSVKRHWQSGFIGGSVGVLGTLAAIQLKVNQVKELTACPYCRSTGQLPCAMCFGMGSVSIPDMVASTNTVTTTTLTCPCCRGKTFVACVNCKGDGRGVPLFLNKKVSRDPESEIEDVGYA